MRTIHFHSVYCGTNLALVAEPVGSVSLIPRPGAGHDDELVPSHVLASQFPHRFLSSSLHFTVCNYFPMSTLKPLKLIQCLQIPYKVARSYRVAAFRSVATARSV
jgi:hypothetical protein